jgi:hypothetical protein
MYRRKSYLKQKKKTILKFLLQKGEFRKGEEVIVSTGLTVRYMKCCTKIPPEYPGSKMKAVQ